MYKSYQAQFDRVKRYFNRFKKINDGKIHDQPSPYYEDDVYAFFQNCYHLKDWIKNDPACARWKAKVEPFINGNPDLSICADICNALKHLALTKRARSDQNPKIADSHIKLNIKDGLGVQERVEISIKYRVLIASGDLDAFELAERCIFAWEQFINANAPQP